MIELKQYQHQTISEFEDYLKRMRAFRENDAHITIFDQIQRQKQNEKLYNIQDVNSPFICIKIPTGGGKTLVACHLLNSLYQEYLRTKNEKGIVMWLVPTDAIRTQTLSTLNDSLHPYRQALNQFFSENILVYDFKESQSIKKTDIQNNLCIIVATFSAFRTTNKEGRKAYVQNGNLLEHFLDGSNENLIKDEDGNVIESLVNVIRMNNPVVILDEGHNAKTKLSYKMLKDFNPSFVLEYTATPRPQSNVLVNITGQQLKDEKMVKIPIYIHNIAGWEETMTRGIAKRNHLEKIAKKEKSEYIRPIVLIQAEQEKQNDKKIYVGQIKNHLVSEQGIDSEEIAIRTGTQNELRGIDLYSKKCKIRYIITVQALKEGWDNAFAYILISVANMASKVSVEQTIGRILRLSKQQEKKNQELNCSYVYTSSRIFEESARAVEKGLLQNGYSKKDFKRLTDKIQSKEIYERAICDDDIKIPCIAIKDKKLRRLNFHDDLLGCDFKLNTQEVPNEYIFYFDENKTKKIDIKQGDELTNSVQTSLDIVYQNKNFDKIRLLNWLDKKIKRIEYSQMDKREYLKKIINHAIEKEKIPLFTLSINCYTLRDIINIQIDKLEHIQAKKKFLELEKSERLLMDEIQYCPEQTLEINNISEELFKLHLFDRAGVMNNEELYLTLKIDGLENIVWWYRNMEKKDFYIQGWQKFRFYPDFIIKTTSGKYVVVEYKGKNLLTNDDTKYKKKIAEKWVELAGDKYLFFLIDRDTIEQFMTDVEKL